MEKIHLDQNLTLTAQAFLLESIKSKYSYNFSSLGRPIIQYPQDMVAMQELIWTVKPDLIIETGIAHGGSLIMSASMLALLDYCDAVVLGTTLTPRLSKRMVLGLDIDIREHNRKAIESHPLSHLIHMIEGSSIDAHIISQVHDISKNYAKILVCLDSNHTHEHVLGELRAYASLATFGSYCVVFDTVVEDLPTGLYPDRPWDVGNNPKTAVHTFLDEIKRKSIRDVNDSIVRFEIDRSIDQKLLISVAPDGYLKRI